MMLYNATRSLCVMCTNIYTLYSQRKCLVDKQTQEQKASVAAECLASYSCPLTVHRSMMWTWELALWTAENQCLAAARWAWCFFYIFFWYELFHRLWTEVQDCTVHFALSSRKGSTYKQWSSLSWRTTGLARCLTWLVAPREVAGDDGWKHGITIKWGWLPILKISFLGLCLADPFKPGSL